MSKPQQNLKATSALHKLFSQHFQGRSLSAAGVVALLALAHAQAQAHDRGLAQEVGPLELLDDHASLELLSASLLAEAGLLDVLSAKDTPQSVADLLLLEADLSALVSADLPTEVWANLQSAIEALRNMAEAEDVGVYAQAASADVSNAVQTDAGASADVVVPAQGPGAVVGDLPSDPNLVPGTSAGPLVGLVITPLGATAAGLGTLAVAAAGRTAGADAPVVAPLVPSAPLLGKVVDSYVAGATVKVIQLNSQNQKVVLFETTTGDGSVERGPVGQYTIPAEFVRADTYLEASGGRVINPDGTSFDNKLTIKAPGGAQVISPLSDLVQELIERDMTPAEANTAVLKALGLDAGINLATYDFIADAGTPVSEAVGKATLSLALIASSGTDTDAQAAIVDMLASNIEQRQGDVLLDLSDQKLITDLLAGTKTNVSAQTLFQQIKQIQNPDNTLGQAIAAQYDAVTAPKTVAANIMAIEDGALLTGQLLASDVDMGAALTFGLKAPVAGLTIKDDGSYEFDPSDAAYQSLAKNSSTDVVATYTVSDGIATVEQSLTITVTGINDALTLVTQGPINGSVSELGGQEATTPNMPVNAVNQPSSVSGKFEFTDVDLKDLFTASHTYVGQTANFQGIDGQPELGALKAKVVDGQVEWTYLLDQNVKFLARDESVTQSYVISVSDGSATVDQEINIQITGVNDAPVIGLGSFSGSTTLVSRPSAATEPAGPELLTASGAFDISDPDQDAASLSIEFFERISEGNSSSPIKFVGDFFTFFSEETSQATWQFSVDKSDISHIGAGLSVVQAYDVVVTDIYGLSVSHAVDVTILGMDTQMQ